MTFNPFFNITVEQYDAGIADIQERMLVGAAKVRHAGSGGMDMIAVADDLANLQHLANRRADLLSEKRPTQARVQLAFKSLGGNAKKALVDSSLRFR